MIFVAQISGKRRLFLLLFFIFIFFNASAQSVYNTTFYINRVLRHRYAYNPPAGFRVMDSVSSFFHYSSNKRKHLYPFDYRLISDKEDVIIGFIRIPLDSKYDSSKVLQKLFPGQTENINYLLKVRYYADTLHGNKINFYSHNKSWRLFYADNAGTFSFGLDNLYEGKFNKCRVVFLHRDNCEDAMVFYFYNDQSKQNRRKVDKLVRRTPKMLRFEKHPACIRWPN